MPKRERVLFHSDRYTACWADLQRDCYMFIGCKNHSAHGDVQCINSIGNKSDYIDVKNNKQKGILHQISPPSRKYLAHLAFTWRLQNRLAPTEHCAAAILERTCDTAKYGMITVALSPNLCYPLSIRALYENGNIYSVNPSVERSQHAFPFSRH